MDETLNTKQITVLRILWELAQGRIDTLYTEKGAEEEKQAIEGLIKGAFPRGYEEVIRANVEV